MSGHLTCQCERRNPEAARSLCGLGVLINSPLAVRDVPVSLNPSVAGECVVCHDLARTALTAGGCERCRANR